MLNDIFRPNCIKLELKSSTKDEVLEELVETLVRNDSGFDRQELLDAVIERENKKNTIIMPGIAVPHGYSSDIDGIIGAIGFSRPGIDYDDPEKNPVHLFFLLLMDASSREMHLRTLNNLCLLLRSKEFAELRGRGAIHDIRNLLSIY